MMTNNDLATTCHYKGKTYEQYCHLCAVRGLNAMDEREFINIGKACDV